MLYRGEIVVNGSVIHAQNYGKATHPNHVARLLVSRVPVNSPYMIVFVANTDGDVWEYSFDKTATLPRVTPMKRDEKLNAVQIRRLFSGTATMLSMLS